MHQRNIEITLPPKDSRSTAQSQYQEWVARFCYASAQLSPGLVEHFLGLMETCSESETLPNKQSQGNA